MRSFERRACVPGSSHRPCRLAVDGSPIMPAGTSETPRLAMSLILLRKPATGSHPNSSKMSQTQTSTPIDNDSIHWDAVIVAQPKSRPFAPNKVGKSSKLWADEQFAYWTERLQHFKGAEFTAVDQLNLRRACYAAALSHPTNHRVGVYDVAELMKQTAQSALPRTDFSAATNEKSNLAIHQNRVPQAAWSGSLA